MSTQLDALYAKERARLGRICDTCNTGERLRPVFGEGPENALLMLIGEAPGASETEKGRPFVGKAGMQLDELLSLACISRERVFVTNAVKYRPTNVKTRSVSNRTPTRMETSDGLPLLREEILCVHPAIIATLGNTPLNAVMEAAGVGRAKIGDVHGTGTKISVEDRCTVLFPLYHPASGIYRRELVDVMKADILKLKELTEALMRGETS